MPRAKKRDAKAKPRTKDKQLDEGVENFSEEARAIGKRIEKKTCEYRGWYYNTFGVVGPFLSAVIGILLLSACLYALNFFAVQSGSAVIFQIHNFLLSNLGVFFLIFILSSYLKYCSWVCPRPYLAFSPFATAFGITVFFWVAANVLSIASVSLGDIAGPPIASYILGHLVLIFLAFTLLGYFVLLIRLMVSGVREVSERASTQPEPEPQKAGEPRRLYRSGRDRILGGVCGGIAEYLGVDPVIIRFLWAIAIVFYGTGLLLYIIAWIIIPRNPNHKWKD